MATSVTLLAYEHQTLRIGPTAGLREAHLTALLALQDRHAARWFIPLRQGIKLTSYVGVIQIPGLTLEILPKLDDPHRVRAAETSPAHWQAVLLRLLRATYQLPVTVPSGAALAQARHSMLELFIIAFLTQTETLLRQGLRKQYRPVEANRQVLRGRLLFAQQLRHNLVHAEQFYSRAQTYDATHALNALLRQALHVATTAATSEPVLTRARCMFAQWPDMLPVPVPAEMPMLTHATARYGAALKLAMLLLQQYSPALQTGQTAAVALLFDMNRLFESYVAQQLRRAAPFLNCQVATQASQPLWHDVAVRPDIVVTLPGGSTVVLDTKWKVPTSQRPTAADLQQLFAYCHLWGAAHGLLVYPNPSAELGLLLQQPYAPGRLASVIHGHVLFVDILLPNGKLNVRFGRQLLNQLINLPLE
jgi:5-methylcytosine-specific restriction enzyme subunit McrC